MAWTVFARSNTGIAGSHPTRGVDVSVHLVCVCAVVCVGSGRTVFIRGTNVKFWEVPNTASSNTNTNIFQERSAGFKATINLNKKVRQGCVSVYVMIVGLISLRTEYNYKKHDGK
jgi:hypothetical protein